MKKRKISYLVVGAILCFGSCDKVDDPIPKDLGTSLTFGGVQHIVDESLNIEDSATLVTFFENGSWVEQTAPDNSNSRFIVLEEFTGHTCKFCPQGTREIVRLDEEYQEQLIPVAIHAGDFADTKTSGEMYTTDFTVDGDHEDVYLQKYNQFNAYPRGIVSRIGKTGNRETFWENDIKSIKDDSPLAVLELKTYFDSTSSIIRANCKVVWNETLPERYNLQLFVVEDNIVDWQLDDDTDVMDYNHRHVLRKVVNGTFGKSLKEAIAGQEEELQYVFPFTEALRENNEKNIEVVAFIFNNDPAAETNDIIQANATKVLPK